MKISYCVTVADEEKEVNNILTQLLAFKRNEDEIIVLLDLNKTTDGIVKYLNDLNNNKLITLYNDKFEGDFAEWKNKLFIHSNGDYIFQIDCDEVINPHLLSNLPILLQSNPDVDLYWIPRINVVNGANETHFKKYGWKISTHTNYITKEEIPASSSYFKFLKKNNLLINSENKEIEYHIPLINFPDLQGRIYRNAPDKLAWVGKVHERIENVSKKNYNYSALPLEEEYCILHIKDISKQEKQNKFYDTL